MEKKHFGGKQGPDKNALFRKFTETIPIAVQNAAHAESDQDWLNTLLNYLWPKISVVVQNAMDTLVEPEIRAAVPQISDAFEITTVMGTIPPILGPASTYADDDNSIVIEMGITWNSDMSVRVDASILSIKVDEIKLTGTLTIKLTPLIDEIPLIGAMHIYFQEPPDIDFRVRVKNSPIPLTNIVHSVASKAVCEAVVLPNRIMAPVALLHQLPSLRLLHNPPPLGILKLTVSEMRNLPIADSSLIGEGSSDPFAEIQVGAHKWASDVVSSSINPIWKSGNVHRFLFYSERQTIRCKVWDYDLTSGNDILGEVTGLTVDAVRGDKWFDMTVAAEFEVNTIGDEGKPEKKCFICHEEFWKKRISVGVDMHDKKEVTPDFFPLEKTEAVISPCVRLQGDMFYLTEHDAPLSDLGNLLEISVTGVRGSTGCKEPCAGQICSVNFDGEMRQTLPSLLNPYQDPAFIQGKIDPSVIFRLGQIHTAQKVASLMDIKPDQVETCLKTGHQAIWCHSFFYLTQTQTGEISFRIGDHEASMILPLSTNGNGWKKKEKAFPIGPFLVEIHLRMSGFTKNPPMNRMDE